MAVRPLSESGLRRHPPRLTRLPWDPRSGTVTYAGGTVTFPVTVVESHGGSSYHDINVTGVSDTSVTVTYGTAPACQQTISSKTSYSFTLTVNVPAGIPRVRTQPALWQPPSTTTPRTDLVQETDPRWHRRLRAGQTARSRSARPPRVCRSPRRPRAARLTAAPTTRLMPWPPRRPRGWPSPSQSTPPRPRVARSRVRRPLTAVASEPASSTPTRPATPTTPPPPRSSRVSASARPPRPCRSPRRPRAARPTAAPTTRLMPWPPRRPRGWPSPSQSTPPRPRVARSRVRRSPTAVASEPASSTPTRPATPTTPPPPRSSRVSRSAWQPRRCRSATSRRAAPMAAASPRPTPSRAVTPARPR